MSWNRWMYHCEWPGFSAILRNQAFSSATGARPFPHGAGGAYDPIVAGRRDAHRADPQAPRERARSITVNARPRARRTVGTQQPVES
jgi:hypothetical protein